MYPFHPPTVHIPIGLLIGNAILTVLYLRRGERAWEVSAYHCLWLGWIFTLPAILTGTYAAVFELIGSPHPRNDALGWINAHAFVGLVMLVVYWQAWQIRRRNPAILDDARARRGYVARLVLGFVLLVVGGWIGGHMVYTLRVGVDR